MGAFGAGKTQILCLKALVLSLRYPRNRILITRKTFTSMKDTTIWKFLELADQAGYPAATWYNKTEHIFTFENGSQVLFGGLEEPSRLGSLEVSAVGVDEAIELDEGDWMMLEGRLRYKAAPFRQIFAAANPCPPGHWLHKKFFERHEGMAIRSNTLQNRFLPADYLVRLDNFQGLYRERFVEGRCVGAQGLVYDCYDPQVHIIQRFEIPGDWPRYRSIDFGYANPFVCLWAAEQPHEPTEHFSFPKGSLFVYREWYRSRWLVEQHAGRIKDFPEPIAQTWADHDAEDRATLDSRGVYTQPAFKEVSLGLQATYRRLAGTQSEIPSLYFFADISLDTDSVLVGERKPTGLLDEIGGYVWEPVVEGRSAKEIPKKENDHAMDALRYLVLGVERASRSPVSFL